MKQTIKQRTVFKEKITKIFINGEDTMAVLNMNQFEGHTGSAVHGVFVTAGRAETAVATERNKLKLTAVRTAIHGTTKRGITTINHFIDIFHLRISGMKSIFYFFIMVEKDSL